MALILTSHDLSTGKGTSSVVSNINDKWRITATTTGCPAKQEVRLDIWVAGGDGNYAPLRREDGTIVELTLTGNQTRTLGIEGVNATSGKVVVYGKTGQTGSINVDSVTSVGSAVVSGAVTVTGDVGVTGTVSLVDENDNYLNPSGTPHADAVEVTRPADTDAYTALDAMARLAGNVAQVETITLTGTAPTLNKWTVTLTGTGGTANMTVIGGLTKLITFNAALNTTASDFVTAFANDYLAVDITLTASGETLIFESTEYDVQLDEPVVVNLTEDLAGTADETTPLVVIGEAEVTGAGGVTATVSFDISTTIDLEATAALFAAAYVGDYASEGIDLTSSGADIIFTAAVAGTPFTAPIITNTVGDLDGTVEHTTANDNVDVLEFENMAIANGGGGYLMDVKLESDIVAIAGTTVRLWFYNDTPVTIIADNAAFSHVYADKDKRLFYVDVDMNAQDGSSPSIIGQVSVIKEYKCADTSLFVQLQTIEGFTPTSGGKINVTLSVLKLS